MKIGVCNAPFPTFPVAFVMALQVCTRSLQTSWYMQLGSQYRLYATASKNWF